MFLRIQTPSEIITREKVEKVIVEDLKGFRGILPRHIDFTTKTIPSILTYEDKLGEGYVAINEGILVKRENEIHIATRDAFESRELGTIYESAEFKMMRQSEESEQAGREITKFEIALVKSFYNLGQS